MSKQFINPELECSRCGCYAMYHQDTTGKCKKCTPRSERGRICRRFCTRETYPQIKFFEFTHWAKKWIKAKRNRTIEQITKIWDHVGNDDTYCTYCPQCDAAVIMFNTTSKAIAKAQDGLSCQSCNACVNCCKCTTCKRCHRKARAEVLCEICNMCGDRCCHCKICRGCSKQCGDDYCHDGQGNGCQYCNACCSCGDEQRVPFYTAYNRAIKFYQPTLKQHTLNPTNRFIAAEIEVAGIKGRGKKIYNKVKEWEAAVVRDGSLPAGGFEINTAPAAGDLYVNQVRELCDAVSSQIGMINDRCGLHVHIDARDFRYYDLRRLVRLYAIIEDALFGMVSAKRRTSRYCTPCGQKYLGAIEEGRLPYEKVKTDVITSVYQAQTTQDNRYSKYNNARYNALNLHSWFYRGTIECRIFDGTINPELISNWGILWAMILDYVVAHTDDEMTKLIKNNSGFGCLATIASSNEKILDFVRRRILECGNPKIREEMAKYNLSRQQERTLT